MGADDELDALRRRLYTPDATDADRAAFAAAEAAATDIEPEPIPAAVIAPPPPPPAAPPPVRTLPMRWRLVAIGGATALVLVGAAAVAIGHPFAPGPVFSSAAPSPTHAALGRIAVPASVRTGFVRDLRAGRDPGLLAYLNVHPETLLQQMRVTGPTDTTGFTGVGPTTLNIAPTAPKTAGYVTLVLITDAAAHFTWTPTTVADSNDRSGPERPVAKGGGDTVAGEPVVGSVAYSGGVPSRLTLIVPAGVHWSAVIIYTG